MAINLICTTRSGKAWTHIVNTPEEAEKYRKLMYAKYRGVVTSDDIDLGIKVGNKVKKVAKVKNPLSAEKALYQKAHQAGLDAADACTPVPMVVVQRANVLDDNSPIVKQYAPVSGGVCGFAWVNIKPAHSKFAKYLTQNDLARKDTYAGGITLWVSDFGQSYEKKCAYARAFAKVLVEADIKAYAADRLD